MTRLLLATLVPTLAGSLPVLGQTPGVRTTSATEFTVTVDAVRHGSLRVTPVIPADGKVAAGTVITLTAEPEPGFVVDALYYSVPGMFGAMYHDTPAVSTLQVTVDQDQRVGAYFIESSAVEGFTVTQDVVFAAPGVKPLKYDVYTPDGAEDLPCVVIIHGGGWSANDEDIMRGLARELARGGKYVVFSVDYRWIGTLDGDATGNTMAGLIEDVFGAIAHIMEHAREYGADPTRIAVTGDSAGGHLAAVVATMANRVGDGGFGTTSGVYEYMPTYMPRNKTVEQVRSEMMSAIRAAAPSYGVFSFHNPDLQRFLSSGADPGAIRAISPIDNIPAASERSVPHFLTRGTRDPLIRDEDVRAYVDALVDAGQTVEYVQVGGASHAFFDWKPDETVEATFRQYGVYYAEEMEHFFDSVFYPDE